MTATLSQPVWRHNAVEPVCNIRDDSPDSAPTIVGEIQEVIDRLRQRGDVAILLVEQFLDFALHAASHYYIMEKGRIVADGPTDQISPATVQQYLAV